MYRSDCDYSFCGYQADGDHQYPISAFRRFCAKRGISFPFGDQGGDIQTFTISEAVVLMLGYENNYAFSWERIKYGYAFTLEDDESGAAAKLQEWLHAQVKRCSNLEYPCYVLAGYVWVNPVDAATPDRAEFPREAYYRLWLAHPMGIACPQWFADLSRDTLPAVPALPDVVARELGECSPARPEASPAALRADGADDRGLKEVCGLSASQVAEVLQASPALSDVVSAFAEFLSIDKMTPSERATDDARRKGLSSRLARKAKMNGWARNGGKLSDAQAKVLTELLLGKNLGGAGNKKP